MVFKGNWVGGGVKRFEKISKKDCFQNAKCVKRVSHSDTDLLNMHVKNNVFLINHIQIYNCVFEKMDLIEVSVG